MTIHIETGANQKGTQEAIHNCWVKTHTSAFEHHLHAQKNDEAYWQYQDKLQQSSLTFHASASHTQAVVPADRAHAKTASIAETTRLLIEPTENSAQTPDIGLPAAPSASSATSHPMRTMHQDIVKQTFNTLIHMMHMVQHNQTRTSPLASAKPLAQDIVFKQHHLFLNDNQAEISLNAILLNPKHIDVLQQRIRTWLTQQGFRLKKLIINGVVQW